MLKKFLSKFSYPIQLYVQKSERSFLAFIGIAFMLALFLSPYPSIAMWVGFLFAAYAAVANDSIQTLGTFIASNQNKKWWVLWIFIGGVFLATHSYSYFFSDHAGDFDRSGSPNKFLHLMDDDIDRAYFDSDKLVVDPLSIDTDLDGIPNLNDLDIDGDNIPNFDDDDIDGDGLSLPLLGCVSNCNDDDKFPNGIELDTIATISVKIPDSSDSLNNELANNENLWIKIGVEDSLLVNDFFNLLEKENFIDREGSPNEFIAIKYDSIEYDSIMLDRIMNLNIKDNYNIEIKEDKLLREHIVFLLKKQGVSKYLINDYRRLDFTTLINKSTKSEDDIVLEVQNLEYNPNYGNYLGVENKTSIINSLKKKKEFDILVSYNILEGKYHFEAVENIYYNADYGKDIGDGIADGDVSHGRLLSKGYDQAPEKFHFLQIAAPIFLLILTRLRMPVSTTFILLTSFAASPAAVGGVLAKSMSGYVMAFFLGLIVFFSIAHLAKKYFVGKAQFGWTIAQWITTGSLWSVWLMQDAANIAVFLPRSLSFLEFAGFAGALVIGLGFLLYYKGGRIQKIVTEKSVVSDVRFATCVDFIYCIILFYFKLYSQVPMSTTWVFIGLLGGRELGMAIRRAGDNSIANTFKLIFKDFSFAMIGLFISIAIAIGVNDELTFSSMMVEIPQQFYKGIVKFFTRLGIG